MKLPEGWVRQEPGWYTNAEERVSVSFEDAASSPLGVRGWYIWPWAPALGLPGGPFKTLAAALAAVKP